MHLTEHLELEKVSTKKLNQLQNEELEYEVHKRSRGFNLHQQSVSRPRHLQEMPAVLFNHHDCGHSDNQFFLW